MLTMCKNNHKIELLRKIWFKHVAKIILILRTRFIVRNTFCAWLLYKKYEIHLSSIIGFLVFFKDSGAL